MIRTGLKAFLVALCTLPAATMNAQSLPQCFSESPSPTATATALPGTVRGRVLAAHSGEALKAISVVLVPDSIHPALDAGKLLMWRFNGIRVARTDSTGRFHVDRVAPGAYGLVVQGAGQRTRVDVPFAVGADGLNLVAVLELVEPGLKVCASRTAS